MLFASFYNFDNTLHCLGKTQNIQLSPQNILDKEHIFGKLLNI